MRARLRFGLEEVALANGETIVGRDESCAIVVADDLVSRAHAAFACGAGYVEIRDLGSRNGTRVNGTKITAPTRLANGDRVRVGPREIVFFDLDAAPSSGRVPHSTGKMTMCRQCDEVVPDESPSCPHCGFERPPP